MNTLCLFFKFLLLQIVFLFFDEKVEECDGFLMMFSIFGVFGGMFFLCGLFDSGSLKIFFLLDGLFGGLDGHPFIFLNLLGNLLNPCKHIKGSLLILPPIFIILIFIIFHKKIIKKNQKSKNKNLNKLTQID